MYLYFPPPSPNPSFFPLQLHLCFILYLRFLFFGSQVFSIILFTSFVWRRIQVCQRVRSLSIYLSMHLCIFLVPRPQTIFLHLISNRPVLSFGVGSHILSMLVSSFVRSFITTNFLACTPPTLFDPSYSRRGYVYLCPLAHYLSSFQTPHPTIYTYTYNQVFSVSVFSFFSVSVFLTSSSCCAFLCYCVLLLLFFSRVFR